MPNERNEEAVDGFLAIGSCDSLAQAENYLNEMEFPGIYTSIVSYEEKVLEEMLINAEGTGFAFGAMVPGKTTKEELTALYSENAELLQDNSTDDTLNQRLIFVTEESEQKLLVIDSVHFAWNEGVLSEIAFAFRFRDAGQMQNAYEVFQNALETIKIADIEVQHYFNGRSCYTAADGTRLEIILDERKQRFDVIIK